MPANPLGPPTLGQLREELNEIAQHARYTRDHQFVAWFVRAHLTEDDELARRAPVGGKRDKGIDGIHIDESGEVVYLIQAKYRASVARVRESNDDVKSLAKLSRLFWCDDDEFDQFCDGSDGTHPLRPLTQERLTEARNRVGVRGYRLRLCYVTLGRFNGQARRVGQRALRHKRRVRLELLDGHWVMNTLEVWLRSGANPVAEVDIPILRSGSHSEIVRRDRSNDITSWVFSVRGQDLAELYRTHGVRLFDKNVRGFLGADRPVHVAMVKTIRSRHPERFWYFNNGVTFTCTGASSVNRKRELRLVNPQIVNGQQTTRALASAFGPSRDAPVLVRVISFADPASFEDVLADTVRGTNFQNEIKQADLMSNDLRQVRIQQGLRMIDYNYLRKRQARTEADRIAGTQHRFTVTSFDLAQASAGCQVEGLPLRKGREPLFSPEYYPTVFPTSVPDYYMSRYWVLQRVKGVAHGEPNHQAAKWLVLHRLWMDLGQAIESRPNQLRRAAERDLGSLEPLDRAIGILFDVAESFYVHYAGPPRKRPAPDTFFKQTQVQDRSLEQAFRAFLAARHDRRSRYRLACGEFRRAIRGSNFLASANA